MEDIGHPFDICQREHFGGRVVGTSGGINLVGPCSADEFVDAVFDLIPIINGNDPISEKTFSETENIAG
jgi:hypothetical protein